MILSHLDEIFVGHFTHVTYLHVHQETRREKPVRLLVLCEKTLNHRGNRGDLSFSYFDKFRDKIKI